MTIQMTMRKVIAPTLWKADVSRKAVKSKSSTNARQSLSAAHLVQLDQQGRR